MRVLPIKNAKRCEVIFSLEVFDLLLVPMPTWTVYLLKCSDNTHYTGCTSNLDDRLERHGRGEVHYTKSRLPVDVETKVVFTDKYKAYEFEKYLKSGSGIAFRNKRLV